MRIRDRVPRLRIRGRGLCPRMRFCPLGLGLGCRSDRSRTDTLVALGLFGHPLCCYYSLLTFVAESSSLRSSSAYFSELIGKSLRRVGGSEVKM